MHDLILQVSRNMISDYPRHPNRNTHVLFSLFSLKAVLFPCPHFLSLPSSSVYETFSSYVSRSPSLWIYPLSNSHCCRMRQLKMDIFTVYHTLPSWRRWEIGCSYFSNAVQDCTDASKRSSCTLLSCSIS